MNDPYPVVEEEYEESGDELAGYDDELGGYSEVKDDEEVVKKKTVARAQKKEKEVERRVDFLTLRSLAAGSGLSGSESSHQPTLAISSASEDVGMDRDDDVGNKLGMLMFLFILHSVSYHCFSQSVQT